jgi:hypothetical protein
MDPNPSDLTGLYSILGQVLDGLWFLETENRLGFDKALEIDLAVWEIYSRKETKRILSLLLENPEDRFNYSLEKFFKLLEQVLKISLFNQSINFNMKISLDEKTLTFSVEKCKTLKGMEKVGRPMDQAKKICKDIGLAYYENMAQEFHPDLKIDCLTVPDSYNIEKGATLCSWKFSLE